MKRLIAALAVAPLALIPVACSDDTGPATTTYGPGDSTFEFPTDAYTTNGCWKVPEQIQPGRYTVASNGQQVVSLRWWSLNTDPYCESPLDGAVAAEKGYSSIGYVTENAGPMYVLIPDDGTVKAFQNNGVKLELVEE